MNLERSSQTVLEGGGWVGNGVFKLNKNIK